jgi:sugar/nucleoside kinase (ribokinase family)
MGEKFGPVYTKVVEHVKANPEIKLAFNPGSRQLRAGVEAIKNVMEVAHIIYVNRREAEELTDMEETQGKEKELLKALADLGPKIPIVTDGNNGSFVFDGNRFLKAGVLPIDAYERTGAGDAFGAGCLAALVKGKSWKEALLWGTTNSASVIGYVGSQKGLLRSDEIVTWLERARSSNVKVVEF